MKQGCSAIWTTSGLFVRGWEFLSLHKIPTEDKFPVFRPGPNFPRARPRMALAPGINSQAISIHHSVELEKARRQHIIPHTPHKMFFILNLILAITGSSAGVIEPMNYYQYTQFQAPLSWEAITSAGLKQALSSCQDSFKWQRWNCPSTDFVKRHTAPATPTPEREDVYVAAISMASIVHTLTKDCANGVIAGCGCTGNALNVPCSHEPLKAVELYEKRFGSGSGAAAHNQRVIGSLLQQSLVQECRCKQPGPQGKCLEEECVKVLKPFEAVAQDLLQMYDDAIQLDSTASNLKIMWENIPLDSLVFMQDSPNYCEPEASGRWTGTRGRQCSKDGSGSVEERLSCQQLCRVCGYRVRTQHVRSERRCNCKLVWGFRLQCDVCVQLERQYTCY
ncbi:wnt inhibitor of Dorsal protein [Drosophila pseudoobscura]|uniref:Protein Wnt n=1 Tax=Drosophila pseudoobscura pseudoobscura TaxID=46245 RepID=A0A6I8UNN7_DROPS|nr:wnt inhibitor of Dorsal protein [Drosophila pseudoobscura]